ncbi:hypothetical protein QAD02_000630 [Eretmocerus hayati]|uniref:Uncharacterized protein n=1 Tax=Eretmocerus hayati TaxID=131215 RepID=A0ACC2NFE3_9HYME|nr:hypothetical protein QAD02_000630 [Eretmocerus hayati]
MDSRRRRRSGASDDMSDSFDELNTTKETQSSEPTETQHDSEYDTAGSESDSNSQDKNQRESGDGQEEEKPQKKLDDDEDRRNPQYIPKRGTFYEHDDRTAEELNDETPEEKPERDPQKEKKVWKDKEDKWNHDRYNDAEQAPKSHAELIAVYGYDIRNEEGPPRARRRRRYGRGPNKYTRNWEDEDAYGKIPGSVPPHKPNFKKGGRADEEFPSLTKDSDVDKKSDQPVITSAWYSNKNKVPPNKTQNFPALQQTESQRTRSKPVPNSQVNENQSPNDRNSSVWNKPKNSPIIHNVNETSSPSVNDSEKIVLVRNVSRDNKKPSHLQESVGVIPSKGRGRGFRASTNNNTVGTRIIESKPRTQQRPGPTNLEGRRSNVEPEQTVDDMKHANASSDSPPYHHASRQNKHFYQQPSSQQSSNAVPPRMQPTHSQAQPHAQPGQAQPSPQASQSTQQDITSNRPKRYSSLRQRPPITEGPPTPAQPNYQPAPQHTYYPPPPQAGSSRAVLESPGYPPGPYESQAPPVPAPGQPVMPLPPPPGAPQPASYAPPPFLVPPPQFIPPQQPPPNIINYVAGPNGPIFSPNYQSYNPAPVPTVPPPQEVGLYQPQGCTYYSPVQQQQQAAPLRRPKAAIPILPPPDENRIEEPKQELQVEEVSETRKELSEPQQQQEQVDDSPVQSSHVVKSQEPEKSDQNQLGQELSRVEQQIEVPDKPQESQESKDESENKPTHQKSETEPSQLNESDTTAHIPIESTTDCKDDEKEEFHDAVEEKIDPKLDDKLCDFVKEKNDIEVKDVRQAIEEPIPNKFADTDVVKENSELKLEVTDSKKIEEIIPGEILTPASEQTKDTKSSDLAVEMISADLSVKVSEMMIDVLAKTEIEKSDSEKDCKVEECAAIEGAAI